MQTLTYTEYLGMVKGFHHIHDEITDNSLEFSPISIIRECINDLQISFRDNPDSKLTPHITNKDIKNLNLLLLQQIHLDEYISMGDFFEIIESLAILCTMICKEFRDNNLLDENHHYIDTQKNFDIAENIIEDILY